MSDAPRLKILLLDDERLVRMSVTARLRRTDFEIVGASTPDEAVALLRREKFQAIITDVVMGDVDGFMFRDIVRGMDRTLPILFFTSLVNDESNDFLNRVFEDRYSSYLPKNAPTEVLVGRLERCVHAYRIEHQIKEFTQDRDVALHLASSVQTSMLPRWAHVRDHIFYGTCWRPVSMVSGDLYDCIPIGSDATIFVFGDISGHGVSASLAMTAVQAFLKQYHGISDEKARDVASIASEIDRFIYRNLHGVAYMSGLVVYFNAPENRVRFCNAGHPELRCYSREGAPIVLNPDHRGGFPLGLMPNASYHDADVVDALVPPDALFFAYSDGIIDLTADEAGEERMPPELLDDLMGETIRSIDLEGVLTSAALPCKLFSLMNDFGYENAQDDITLMVFGRTRVRPGCFYVEVSMDIAKIDLAVRRAGDMLAADPRLADVTPRVELLLGEFLMNLHDHGFDPVTRHKEFVLVRLQVRPEDIVVSIWHRARPWDVASNPISPDLALERANARFDTHGRGVAIIRKLVTRSSRQSFAGLNLNMFYVPIKLQNVGFTPPMRRNWH